MITTGILNDISIDYVSEKTKISLTLDTHDINNIAELKDTKLDVEIKKWRNTRSLNANNYAWKLITEIGNVLRMDKEDVYFKMLQSYGQSQMISVLSEIDVGRFLKYYEKAGESILNGKNFTHYKVYTGSSEYDTKEMSILIDGIVEECKNLGIETLAKPEIESLLNEWR
jgi:hypothetical protein